MSANSAARRAASVAVVGATGLAGGELVRLLLRHPFVRIAGLTASPGSANRLAADAHPFLWGCTDLVCVPFESEAAADAEIVILATPDAVSSRAAASALKRGSRVIDLSGAFRLKDGETFRAVYGYEHPAPDLAASAVYALAGVIDPAVLREARLVANPGCYPTAALIALLPLAAAGAIAHGGTVIVDAKSGVSGAGRRLAPEFLYGEVAENCTPYGLPRHRHQPEIAAALPPGSIADLVFVPHLLPAERGLLATCYVPLADGWSARDAHEAIVRTWRDDPFVRVLPESTLPTLRHANGTPLAVVGMSPHFGSRQLIIACAIDNLLKGAASQAVENLNMMLGLDRQTALL